MKTRESSTAKPLRNFAMSKPVMLMLMGLSLGFSLNLLLSSLINNHCDVFSPQNEVLTNHDHAGSNFELHYKSKIEIETESLQNKNKKKQRVVRPRFLSTELSIKEKLFISSLTSPETLETFGSAINETMYIPNPRSKFIQFMNGASKKLLSRPHLVVSSENRDHLVPFSMLKYIADNYLHDYNWFYIFPDTTFVNREKLEEFVDHLSVGGNLLIGAPLANKHKMCDFNAGILFSQGVLVRLSQNLQRCFKHSLPEKSHFENLDLCFQGSMAPLNVTCNSYIDKLTYKFLRRSSLDGKDFIDTLQLQYNSYISFSTLTSEVQAYLLHRKLSENNKVLLNFELLELEKASNQILPFVPHRNFSQIWPLGSDAQSRAKNRFDVIRWHYFNDVMIFHDRFEDNFKVLKGVDKLDVSDILKVALTFINTNETTPLTLEKLVNGYRRFDSSRGMEYIIDIVLRRHKRSPGQNELILRRVHLVRPLGFAEIVTMPYVVENTRVNLILTVTPEERSDVLSFIDSFAHTCIESGDNSHLLIVFVYESLEEEKNDIYDVVKSTASFYESKYHNEGKITWTSLTSEQSDRLLIIKVIEAVYKGIPQDSVILTCTTGMELKIDFLNRVRMNTILGWQVYFPIGYWSYKPNLVYDQPPYPTSILINQKSGRYCSHEQVHASFYLSDYTYSKNQMFAIGAETNFISFYEMFLSYHSINILRAVDPALRLHHKTRNCSGSHESCLRIKYGSLASRSQLAMLLFEHQQKLDEQQLHVMHQQQGENVGHMKPDMLK